MLHSPRLKGPGYISKMQVVRWVADYQAALRAFGGCFSNGHIWNTSQPLHKPKYA